MSGRGGGRLADEDAGRRPTIFVIDDDPAIRRALFRLARAVGYHAETFGSAEEFLADPPSADSGLGCILLDVSLPGLNGPQLHGRLRNGGCDLPVIYVTAHDDPITLAAIEQTDAAAVFAKPVDVAALLIRIEEVLGLINSSGRSASSEPIRWRGETEREIVP